jgi:glycosyltransferase involved in cell wall biosynthesis
MRYKVGILSTHPVQYYTPWYRELAGRADLDLTVYYAHQATPQDQAAAGFGVAFEWDVPLLTGYPFRFLPNRSAWPCTGRYFGCDTPEIADVIRREEFDGFVVHGVRGDSTLLTAGGRVKRLVKSFTHRRFISRFDAYLVVGRRAREYYLAYGADPARMVFCPHFVDNAGFARAAADAQARRVELRRQWGLSEAAVVFVFAGKFIPLKRPSDFVRAVAAAAREVPGVAGLMVGDGPLRPEVQSVIRDLAAPVKHTGFLNQTMIPQAYAAGDALVLSSEAETWGLVVNEAMACGLPAVVSSRVGCAGDLVIDGETGFVYPCGELSALMACLVRLAADLQLRTRLAAAARKRVEGYSPRAAADGLCQAIAQLSARRRSR